MPILFAKKAVYIIGGLLLSMLSIACLYFSLNAMFLAIIQIIVYTGAILIAFVFIVSNTSIASSDSFIDTIKSNKLIAYIFSGIFFIILLVVSIFTKLPSTIGLEQVNNSGNVKIIGETIFKLIPITVVAVGALLCISAFGVVFSLKNSYSQNLKQTSINIEIPKKNTISKVPKSKKTKSAKIIKTTNKTSRKQSTTKRKRTKKWLYTL